MTALQLLGQVEHPDLLAGRCGRGQLEQQGQAAFGLGVLLPDPLPHGLHPQADQQRRSARQGQEQQ